ncbi:MAG TPA: SRPBCC domain-containing protein [Nitrososphaerales archaeon]|nr:SRPBCC domain-containing protein [Nitrososphaerales archaeon]
MTTSEQGSVKVTRVFGFPRESVFRMWTDPKKLAEWWGPKECVVVHSEIDPRPGGTMKVDQRFPDGDTRLMTAIFDQVKPPELLVFRVTSPGEAGFSPWEALHTVTFEELGPRRTRLTAMTSVTAGPQGERESLRGAYRAGWGESLDKLQRALDRALQ